MAITEAGVLSLESDRSGEGEPEGLGIGASVMRVRKRNGSLEPVDVNKIVRAVARCAEGLSGVDPMWIATRTISGLRDGATSLELDELSIRTAAAFISAARMTTAVPC